MLEPPIAEEMLAKLGTGRLRHRERLYLILAVLHFVTCKGYTYIGERTEWAKAHFF